MSILGQIVKYKQRELESSMRKKPMEKLQKEATRLPKTRSRFYQALKKSKKIAVIAEIKKRSPSKGILRKDFKPVEIARAYEAAGASALSILTDENFFGGSISIFKKIRAITQLPLLRKDFTIHKYQIYESKLIGADAVLLIADILSSAELKNLSVIAGRLGMDVLFEVHNLVDIEKVALLKPKIIGINNRDLHTFQVDLNATERLIKRIPAGAIVISESGIQTSEDLKYLKSLGVKAALVGESLMKEKDPGSALLRLRAGA